MKTNKINFLIKNFKLNYSNKNSKWFTSDVKDYIGYINSVSASKLDLLYSNAIAFNSPEFERNIEKEEKKMLKAGLYEMGNMKPVNALD